MRISLVGLAVVLACASSPLTPHPPDTVGATLWAWVGSGLDSMRVTVDGQTTLAPDSLHRSPCLRWDVTRVWLRRGDRAIALPDIAMGAEWGDSARTQLWMVWVRVRAPCDTVAG